MASFETLPQAEANSLEDGLLYRSTGVSPLRVLTVVALAFAVGSALLAALLLDTTVHFGNAISWAERTVWASGLFLAFSGFFLAVWMYERRVAASIELREHGTMLRVATPTLFGMNERDIPVDDLLKSQYYDGDRRGEEDWSTPWLWVKVRNSSSLFVPLSGVIPDRERLLHVLGATR